jgi:TM2 domain-containing membrane protein YozV
MAGMILKLPNDVLISVVPKNRSIWWRQVCRRTRDAIDSCMKVELALSSMGCERVLSSFFLKFVKGIDKISCGKIGRAWICAVADAIRKGSIISEIETRWCWYYYRERSNLSIYHTNGCKCYPRLKFEIRRNDNLDEFVSFATAHSMFFEILITAVVEPKTPFSKFAPSFRGSMPELIDFFEKISCPQVSSSITSLKIRSGLMNFGDQCLV